VVAIIHFTDKDSYVKTPKRPRPIRTTGRCSSTWRASPSGSISTTPATRASRSQARCPPAS